MAVNPLGGIPAWRSITNQLTTVVANSVQTVCSNKEKEISKVDYKMIKMTCHACILKKERQNTLQIVQTIPV